MTTEENKYVGYLNTLSLENLRKEKEYYEKELEDAVSVIATTSNMVEQFYDNPGMEHLLDMQIPSTKDAKLKEAFSKRRLLIINNIIDKKNQ